MRALTVLKPVIFTVEYIYKRQSHDFLCNLITRKICSAQISIQMLRLLTQHVHVSLNEVAGYSEIAPNSVPLY